ncbi:GvpL/GvpF family gas vesicle protein [Streptomyces tubercidicus]|uniref:Gas vesicle protein n=1 Tax=Streptomyces tubercidicus TaxID=47759 RepID=A0A640V5R2_9ACTN|nr:GvpL/GvpF family gas vesicle protein [Streptomyces tubercidicus]WAU16296.1 GvpL/GvpF family gas vesicle protein [Streptomyces tubercidicus]GFE42255.1 gas vesicle protein [Streptomyces tubercidicus]
MTHDGVYVYGIVRAAHPVPTALQGVGNPPEAVTTLKEGRLAAVVSPAPPQLRARRRDLLAHQELLLTLAEQGPLLPMRFGMVAPDEMAVRRQLADAEDRHLAVLERVADRVEINLKAMPANDSLAAVVRDDRTVRELREAVRRRPSYEANVRLGEAVATALSRRAAEAGRDAVAELRRAAHAVAAGPEVSGCVMNVSFLVNRDDCDGFTEQARLLAQRHRDRADLRVAGPLPCYSFMEPEHAAERTGV